MTKRKKELIELMYEAGIREFPEGGEFAAQDKNGPDADKVSFFYGAIPVFWRSADVWGDAGWCRYLINESVKLPQLCKNWNRTVVTREQYAEYCKMREREESSDVEAGDAVEDALIGEQPKTSILDMMHHCNDLRETAKQKAADATAAVGEYNDAMGSLKSAALSLGYKIESIDVSGELSPSTEAERPIDITDWRDLQVGDVIEQVSGTTMSKDGSECAVVKIDSDCSDALHIRGKFSDGEERWISKFKFIRRQ